MKNIMLFEDFSKDQESDNQNAQSSDNTSKLKELYNTNKKLTIKFGNQIGGLSSITFIKTDKKYPKVQESILSIIKALKSIWNKAKSMYSEIVKSIAGKLGVDIKSISNWFSRIFKMNDQQISQELTTESVTDTVGIIGVCVCIAGIILAASAITLFTGGVAAAGVGTTVAMSGWSLSTWIAFVTGVLITTGGGIVVSKSDTIASKIEK